MVMEYSDSLVHCGGPNVRGITRDVPPIDTSINEVPNSPNNGGRYKGWAEGLSALRSALNSVPN